MEEEELETARGAFTPRDLETLSIEELEKYIALLNAEIDRVRRDIEGKKTHMNAAASLFRQK